MTKADLENYRFNCKEIAQMQRHIEELESLLCTVKSYAATSDNIPKKQRKGTDPANTLQRLQDTKELYINKLDKLLDRRKQITEALEALPQKERVIMTAHYIEGMPWEQVAEKTDYSVMRMWQISTAVIKEHFSQQD